jgi:hypothetical protein
MIKAFLIGGIVTVILGVVIYFCRNLIKQGFTKLFNIIKSKFGMK